jgi:hypothetical protein
MTSTKLYLAVNSTHPYPPSFSPATPIFPAPLSKPHLFTHNTLRRLFHLLDPRTDLPLRRPRTQLRLLRQLPASKFPVVQEPVSLCDLGGAVDEVAAEEEVVLGLDGERVPHEDGAVEGEGQGHWAGYTGVGVSNLGYVNGRGKM